MIKSKNMFILIIFAVMLAFCLQTISATSIDSNSNYTTSEKCLQSDAAHDFSINDYIENSNLINKQISAQSDNVIDRKEPASVNVPDDKSDFISANSNLFITGNSNAVMDAGRICDEDDTSINMQSSQTGYDDVGIKTLSSKNRNIKQLPNQKEQVAISVDDLTCNVNDCILINVQFNTSDVTEGVLIFYVDDDVVATHNLSHSANTLEFDTYGYEVGLHDIYVEYTASLIYEAADTHANLTINKHPTFIENFNSQFTDANDINVTFDLISGDEYVTDSYIKVYSNDELIKSLYLNDSTSSIILPGSYNSDIIRICYDGDEYYEALEDYQLINVDKRHLAIYTPAITAYHSSQNDVTVTINNDTKIVDGRMELYVDNLLIYTEIVTSNTCNMPLNLTGYLEGIYELKVIYTDSDVFDEATYTTTLKVNRIKTVVYTNNITTYRNSTITLRASVYNYVDDTNEGLIEFFIDDETIQTAQITNNTLSYDYVIPDTLDYGVHNIHVVYYGSDKYLQSEQNATLTVNKYKTTIYIRNTTIDDEGLININLNLYSYNQSVDDGRVDCYVNGQLIASGIAENNTAVIRLPGNFVSGVGYDVRLVYTNSDYFNDSTLNARMEHNKTNTTISISKYLSNKNILNITAYVYAKDYSNISEGTVKVYLNDMLIDTSTVENNMANTSYDMTDYAGGNYTLFVEYSGSNRYAPSDNTTNVEKIIIPKTIYINTQTSIKTTPEESVTIRANLTDYESNLITDKINATITFNNQTLNATFTNGQLELNITAPEAAGKYTMEIISTNTTNYKQAKRNITLNVARNNTYISSPNTISSLKLEDVVLNLTLNDNNGLVQTKTPLQIKIANNTIYQGYFINGQAKYTLKLNTSYTQSQYNITVIAGQTKTYSSSTKNMTLNLQNRKTYIKSENIYSKKGNQIIFNAELFDGITHKRVNKTIPVVIKLNDLTILATNTTNGHIIETYPNEYNNNNYTITIKSATTGIYDSSQWNGTLINMRDNIKLSAKNIYAKANSTITIKATIYKKNQLTTDRIPVAIKINNLTIATMNVTNSQIEYQYKLPDNLSQKEYNLTIVTADTENVIQSTTNFKLFVTKNYQQINIKNITSHRNATVNIRANITDKNGGIIKSNELVNIKVAGITIANINATDGIIDYNYTLPNLKCGNYEVILKTGQTACYMHATSQSQLKIVD